MFIYIIMYYLCMYVDWAKQYFIYLRDIVKNIISMYKPRYIALK